MRTSKRYAHEVVTERARGLECLLGGQRRDPEWRPRLLGGPRQRRCAFETVESAAGRDLFLLEQAPHLLQSLLEPGAALVHGDAETGELMRQEGARESHLKPAAGNGVHHTDLACELQRIVEHRQHRTGDETHRARQRRRRTEKDERIGTVAAVGQKIMLDRAHIGEAQLLGELRELERLAPILVGGLLLGTDGGKELYAELHRSPEVAQSSTPIRRSTE